MTAAASSAATVQAAVDRALSKQRAEATREVEAVLDAALRVAERVSPAAPRVADIVAEAGLSNQAFYRYFGGKDDLMRAVYERGIARLHSYLEHQVSKETEPAAQVEAWIRGVLTQVTDRQAARQSAAIIRQLGRQADLDDGGLIAEVGALLTGPVAGAGSASPERDAELIAEAVFGVMRRHAQHVTAPGPAECDHVVGFCLRGLTRA